MDRFTAVVCAALVANGGVGTPYRVGLLSLSRCRKHHGRSFTLPRYSLRNAVTIEGETRDYGRRYFLPRCGSVRFRPQRRRNQVNLGSLDAPDQLTPTYES